MIFLMAWLEDTLDGGDGSDILFGSFDTDTSPNGETNLSCEL